jgi:hypothetical protein
MRSLSLVLSIIVSGAGYMQVRFNPAEIRKGGAYVLRLPLNRSTFQSLTTIVSIAVPIPVTGIAILGPPTVSEAARPVLIAFVVIAIVVVTVAIISWLHAIATVCGRSPVAAVPESARSCIVPVAVNPRISGARAWRSIGDDRSISVSVPPNTDTD